MNDNIDSLYKELERQIETFLYVYFIYICVPCKYEVRIKFIYLLAKMNSVKLEY